MATSGVHTFSLDVSELCEEAYERCGLEMRSGYDAKSARRSLNLMLLEWSNHQVNLWKSELLEISLTQGTTNYALATSVTDVGNVTVELSTGSEINMTRLSRDEYANISNKSVQGMPTQYWFHRLATPEINIYPAPKDNTYTLRCYAMEQVESVTNTTETIDVPNRFIPALVAGLAYYISLKKNLKISPNLKMVYDEELKRAQYEDRERVSFMALPKVS